MNATVWMVFSVIAMTILPFALMAALQVWLCRRGGKWLGLVLPGLSLLTSLVICFSFSAYQVTSISGSVTAYDANGQVTQENHQPQTAQRQVRAADVGALAGMFLVFNIPTLAFGGIWLYHKNRRDWADSLRKMNIEDLE